MMNRIEHDGIIVDGRKLIFRYRSVYCYLTLISIYLEFVADHWFLLFKQKFLDLLISYLS